MKGYLDDSLVRGTLYVGDNLEHLRKLPDNSVDSVVTDPPYGLGKEPDPRTVLRDWLVKKEFRAGGSGLMGCEWDAFVPSPALWMECYRVLKPGGHLLSFAGTRTYDWIVMGARLANFEVRDMMTWHYGSGFPKGINIGMKVDEAMGGVRSPTGMHNAAAPAQTWRENCGHGTAKPATYRYDEPSTEAGRYFDGWSSALKPACEPILVARKPLDGPLCDNMLKFGTGGINVRECEVVDPETEERRWPANVMHDGSDEVVSLFPDGSSRFFYSGKAAVREKEAGLDHLNFEGKGNIHPTVKPINLMRWMVKMVTPKGGTVLDPYSGSGSTLVAAQIDGFRWIGMELMTDHALISYSRIVHWANNPPEDALEAHPPYDPERFSDRTPTKKKVSKSKTSKISGRRKLRLVK